MCGPNWVPFMCGANTSPSFNQMAVKSLTLGIERGECFGLLGPNGAGKTTSINVLTGFLEPSSGYAIVEGLDISVDMLKIYKLMGVCPQHDLLWEQLTGEEHLLFYGRLKGFDSESLPRSHTCVEGFIHVWRASYMCASVLNDLIQCHGVSRVWISPQQEVGEKDPNSLSPPLPLSQSNSLQRQ